MRAVLLYLGVLCAVAGLGLAVWDILDTRRGRKSRKLKTDKKGLAH